MESVVELLMSVYGFAQFQHPLILVPEEQEAALNILAALLEF